MSTQDRPLDRFDCYELCVQSPRHVAEFLRAVHGDGPTVLREDFCGTAALSRRWVADGRRAGEHAAAHAIDLDTVTLAGAQRRASAEGLDDDIRFTLADCVEQPVTGADGCDVLFVGNFSIGYIHERSALVAYMRRCRERLALGRRGFGGGVFVCDTYGGAAAFQLGAVERRHPSRGRDIIRYTWRHDAADPLTGMVENSISFRIERDGEIIEEMPDAFTYRWRLWSIAELREALREAGFAESHVYRDANIAPGQAPTPVTDPRELGLDWIVLIAARA